MSQSLNQYWYGLKFCHFGSPLVCVTCTGLKLLLALILRNLLFTLELVQNVATADHIVQFFWGNAAFLDQVLEPSKLLANVFLVILHLLGDLGIIFGVFILYLADLLEELRVRFVATICSQVGDHIVQGWDNTTHGVEAPTGSPESSSLLVQEIHHLDLGRMIIVFDWSLRPLGEVLDGGIRLNVEALSSDFGYG